MLAGDYGGAMNMLNLGANVNLRCHLPPAAEGQQVRCPMMASYCLYLHIIASDCLKAHPMASERLQVPRMASKCLRWPLNASNPPAADADAPGLMTSDDH
jgi:hypothetical protein